MPQTVPQVSEIINNQKDRLCCEGDSLKHED